MFLINEEPVYSTGNDTLRRVIIQADETPASFPATGDDVSGLADEVVIARGSIVYVVKSGKKYFLAEDGETWNEFGAGETP
jgi:hypothetical protein